MGDEHKRRTFHDLARQPRVVTGKSWAFNAWLCHTHKDRIARRVDTIYSLLLPWDLGPVQTRRLAYAAVAEPAQFRDTAPNLTEWLGRRYVEQQTQTPDAPTTICFKHAASARAGASMEELTYRDNRRRREDYIHAPPYDDMEHAPLFDRRQQAALQVHYKTARHHTTLGFQEYHALYLLRMHEHLDCGCRACGCGCLRVRQQPVGVPRPFTPLQLLTGP